MKFCKEDIDQILQTYEERGVRLEGNILKLIDDSSDERFKEYLKNSIELDNSNRRKRLSITKKIQSQNKELLDKDKQNKELMKELREALISSEMSSDIIRKQNDELLTWKSENEKLQTELKEALQKAEIAKKNAEEDLDFLQKKSQHELIGNIVWVALTVILGVAIISTVMYMLAMWSNKETQLIGSTWSNTISILITNAFSIVGTITGVKYADNARSQIRKKN